MHTGAMTLAEQRQAGSCQSRAAIDEPIFILRAQDVLAPRVVVRWAHLAEQADAPLDKVQGALKRAKEMADWQAQNPDRVKVPD
jgi:hypothetical protein